ncbi:MAG: glycogen debranching enzyme family protein [Deltaproteobacteria bacterium]|nr:glycogen debranching enzyme family protein [Deltaproteobacteria bacterium]
MICIDFPQSSNTGREPLNLEWLDTNGRGGYASSTLVNCHTRKYHGLLVANLQSPPGRHVLLSKFEDAIVWPDEEVFLSQHRYPGLLFPPVMPYFKEYILDVCHQFIYRTESLQIRKSIMMIHGEDCILIKYDIERCPEQNSGRLRIMPFLAYRGYHHLAETNTYLNGATAALPDGFKIEPYEGMPPLYIQTNVEFQFSADPVWYNRFEYPIEKERGFDAHEDLFRPGTLDIPVNQGATVIISVSTYDNAADHPKQWEEETERRLYEINKSRKISAAITNDDDRRNMEALMTAGGRFMIHTPAGRPAIIAGYHWFTDWGRDTLISLPGLTFCRHRHEEGINILTMLARHEKDGLLPNYFSEDEAMKSYNSIDASLWYFWAVQQMLIYTKAIKLIEDKLWPVMKSMVKNFMAGTAFNVFMNKENGLLHAGDASTQLTWMDAISNGKPVTPRWGYAVEINALWYNALCFTRDLAIRFGDQEPAWAELTDMIRRSFFDAFWLKSEGYLADCIQDDHADPAIRPNQILAISLPYSPLTDAQATRVVHVVREHLLTPVGLRTLSPSDKRYRGLYGGDSTQRDSAYHQGTVWPWLFGHFGEAYLRVSRDKEAAKSFLLDLIRSFLREHLQDGGIGSISEIFDGDPPHRPNGCIAQAWSVAEVIRLYSIVTRK